MSLLTLPIELRHEIYSYFVQPNPLGFGPCISIRTSHYLPPSPLQRTCRFLYHDTTAYYYSITTIEFSSLGPNPSSTNNARAITEIRNARTIDFVMKCCSNRCGTDIQCLDAKSSASSEAEAMRVLVEEAGWLEKLVMTVRDRCTATGWDGKEERVEQLRELKGIEGDVVFVVGRSTFWEEYDEEVRRGVEECVGELNAMRA